MLFGTLEKASVFSAGVTVIFGDATFVAFFSATNSLRLLNQIISNVNDKS